tara:strand:- start:365 stop:565 length:201 start_codon:yes stop_codon:yes gene_type:complete
LAQVGQVLLVLLVAKADQEQIQYFQQSHQQVEAEVVQKVVNQPMLVVQAAVALQAQAQEELEIHHQ